MPASTFHTTRHAELRIEQRGLSLEALRNLVNSSDRREDMGRGQHGGIVYRFEKTVDGQTLICVAECKKAECWIITGYYEDQ